MIKIEGNGGISATMVEDSISPDGIRLTTMSLRYHRFVHAEFMTHRQFSRNASSSRAIPVERMLKQVETDPAMPIHWGKNQPGMQAREEHNEPVRYDFDRFSSPFGTWRYASHDAINYARAFSEAGYHKQIVNRLTEPFQFINVLVTATEFSNFFNLRLHPDAQPEIHELARCMKECMDKSTPQLLHPGEWHLPLVDKYDAQGNPSYYADPTTVALVSAARCARVSYNNHDGSNPGWDKDLDLANRLLKAGHMSPFEHSAKVMRYAQAGVEDWESGVTHIDRNRNYWSANFRGFIQHRQLLEEV